jgi:isopentenyl phosphate kinase
MREKDNHYPLIFIKLGGSLITEKSKPLTARQDVIERAAKEISRVWIQNPSLRLLIGHGSGSFGHSEAKKHNTQDGVQDSAGWMGFAQVWYAANLLNRMVIDALQQQGLPAISLSPLSMIISRSKEITAWNIQPLRAALEARLLPVIQGDVIFDERLGGCILSTEDLFVHLVPHFRPQQVLLAGIEPGVWADYPACTRLLDVIAPNTDLFENHANSSLQGSSAPDVTGGMAAKVKQSLAMIKSSSSTVVYIFSGEQEKAIENALQGKPQGTKITAFL